MPATSLVIVACLSTWATFTASVLTDADGPKGNYTVCRSKVCKQRAKLINESLDRSVDPCDDFYSYACGGWIKSHPVPESKSTTGTFRLLHDELQETLKGILESMTLVYECQNITDKAAVAYNACMAVPTSKDRPDVMLKIMNISGLVHWPITEDCTGKLFKNCTEVLNVTGHFPILSVSVGRDVKKLNSNIIGIDQIDFLTVGRNQLIHPDKEENKGIIAAYKQLIKAALSFMRPNISDWELTELSDTIVDFEGQLANLTAPPEERRDFRKIYNRVTIRELQENFTNVKDLAKRLMAVFNETLQSAEWMDNETRKTAEAKLAKMGTKIGYPDWLHNTTYLEELYRFVPQLGSNCTFAEMLRFIARNHWVQQILKLPEPYDKDAEWLVGPAFVNAFYNPSNNEMVYPSGVLQGALYKRGLPSSVNYGAIGMVVGHEMTHGFDDMGSQFDADGALKQWWTNDTRAHFEEKAKCFQYQYGNITDQAANMSLNGRNTVGENIADNGGLRMAFRAYNRLLKEGAENETRLAGLEDLSGQQLFFIANGMVWCSNSRPEYLRQLIQYDPHSPHRYRVNVPMGNMEAFSIAFNCPSNSTMILKNRCTLW
ncbi:neprilysin-1-like isoform X2 [Amblyomma americanum]